MAEEMSPEEKEAHNKQYWAEVNERYEEACELQRIFDEFDARQAERRRARKVSGPGIFSRLWKRVFG